MKIRRLPVWLLAALPACAMAASFNVTVTHDLETARPGETIVIPFSAVRERLPGVLFDHVAVRNTATGKLVPAQVTNFNPDDRAALYDDLVWQHDFGAGEREARFTVETTEAPVPPWPAQVFARHVPERLDDFAFENDRIAHRIYGPGLDTEAAGKSRMIGSGIDVWAKRVRYPIVDRWYLKGHDAYHIDSGEGLDFYSAGTARGMGGTAVWRDGQLHTSHNWEAWRVLANGPIRAVFELTYAPWDAGNGVMVSEKKRFTVDAGRNLHRIDSSYATTPAGADFTLAIGLGKHEKPAPNPVASHSVDGRWLSVWETYLKADEAQLGTAVVLADELTPRFTEDANNFLMLVPAQGGATITYHAGAGWTRSGDFADRAAWEAYVADFAKRLQHPISIHIQP